MKLSKLLFIVSLAFTAPIFCMVKAQQPFTREEQVLIDKKLRELHEKTYANEQRYGERPAERRQMITISLMQPVRGFTSLENYINALTDSGKSVYMIDKVPYKRLDPNDWHMSLITIALPLSPDVLALQAQNKQEYIKRIREIAEEALNVLGEAAQKSLSYLNGVAFSFDRIAGIGTNKFVAAYFGFIRGRLAFFKAYTDIIGDFLEHYPDAWMLYGFDPIPHVSVLEKSYDVKLQENKPAKSQQVAFKGSGRDIQKVFIIVPRETTNLFSDEIRNLKLLHAGRDLEVSARGYAYPPFETDEVVMKYARKGMITVTPEGIVREPGVYKPATK